MKPTGRSAAIRRTDLLARACRVRHPMPRRGLPGGISGPEDPRREMLDGEPGGAGRFRDVGGLIGSVERIRRRWSAEIRDKYFKSRRGWSEHRCERLSKDSDKGSGEGFRKD
jgi:hypothetical protein